MQADSLPYEPPENPDPGVHGYTNPQEKISKPNWRIHEKNNTLWSNGIYSMTKDDLLSAHQSMWYTIWAKLRRKSCDLLNNCRKNFPQSVTAILIQSLNTVVIHGTY